MKKIINLKKAVREYKEANKEGTYNQLYSYLMFDKNSFELWTDEFCSIGHNSYKQYQTNVVNLGRMMKEREIEISMKNVKQFIDENF